MTVKRGYECKLFRNTGTYDVPVWDEVDMVRDLSLPLERNEYDGTTRASGDFEAAAAGLVKAPLDFDILWDTANADFQALRSAFTGNTTIDVAILDRNVSDPEAVGLRATMTVLKFDTGQPVNGLATAAISMKPAVSEHTPVWMPVP